MVDHIGCEIDKLFDVFRFTFDVGDALYMIFFASGKIVVKAVDVISMFKQSLTKMTSDKTRSTGYQNFFLHLYPFGIRVRNFTKNKIKKV